MNARLLIVTPTLGESEYLDEAMASTLSPAHDTLHVLSCPEPQVAALAERFPHCKVVPDAGRAGGIYGALNPALDAVRDEPWDWFTYINDDDALGADFFKILDRHVGRAEPEPVVYGSVRLIDEKSAPFGWITTEPDPRKIPLMLHQTISPLNQQGMLFSRAAVLTVHEFDLRYKLCADLDFWVRAYAADHAFRFYRGEMGKFRIRAGQLSGDVNLTRSEFQKIVAAQLPDRPSPLTLRLAKLRYRLINLPRYLERFKNRGIKTSEAVLSDAR